MSGRLYHLLVVCLWLVSMTWLVVEKVLPPLLGGSPPDYDAVLARPAKTPDCWRLVWNSQAIGFVASRVIEREGNAREMRSVVQFENLPLKALLAELLGAFAKFVSPFFGQDGDVRINALLATRLRFDNQRRLTEFRTVADVGDMPGLLTLRGTVTPEGKLEVVAQLGEGDGVSGSPSAGPIFRQAIDLPRQALVNDTFTPRAQLNNLRVGQSWTIPVYRPFPPASPLQMIEAKVERHDVILWDGNEVETLLIVYRTDAGSGVQAARDPVGWEWVRRDGVVLRQEIALSRLRLRFERLPDAPVDPRAQWLDDTRHPRLWGTAATTASSSSAGRP